jgi:hypothetical protein
VSILWQPVTFGFEGTTHVNLRHRYWLYVVFDCGSAHPRLLRVQDPFEKLLARNRGGVVVRQETVFSAAEPVN